MEPITIRDLIQQTGLTQAAFAEAFHIPKRTVEDWASGRRTPPEYVPYLISLAIKNPDR